MRAYEFITESVSSHPPMILRDIHTIDELTSLLIKHISRNYHKYIKDILKQWMIQSPINHN